MATVTKISRAIGQSDIYIAFGRRKAVLIPLFHKEVSAAGEWARLTARWPDRNVTLDSTNEQRKSTQNKRLHVTNNYNNVTVTG